MMIQLSDSAPASSLSPHPLHMHSIYHYFKNETRVQCSLLLYAVAPQSSLVSILASLHSSLNRATRGLLLKCKQDLVTSLLPNLQRYLIVS